MNLVRGGLRTDYTLATALFSNCGQGLREGGDVKLRGVLVGRIGTIDRDRGRCSLTLELRPADIDQIPANIGAQIRAKTVFGEKWVELLYPDRPFDDRLAAGDVIPSDRTIEPLEVETILNLSAPLLEAIDPENLAAALNALAEGFAGHEEAAQRGIDRGLEALAPIIENPRLFREAMRQLNESGEVFDEIDEDLIASFENLDAVNRFTVAERELIAANLQKAPALLRELSTLFELRFVDLTKLVNRGATVISVLAARSDDLDRLLDVLPSFNSKWIRNLNHVCRHRQVTDEDTGKIVPGRCWRVHNIISTTQGGYGGTTPGTGRAGGGQRGSAAPVELENVLGAPLDETRKRLR